jgi:signal transduction histidine kinase
LPNKNSYSLARSFGNLKVRLKLIVLHNLFFLVLTCAAYFSLIPSATSEFADAQTISRAKTTLFLVLGSIYIGAVLLLEVVIMPLYVYRPLRQMLDADTATRSGDRERELIPQGEILGDEIGQIMRSRNETVAALRRQEDELATALRRLEEQDRLVSLGLLSASVAHELNTPLAVLHGSIEKLIEITKDPHTLERLARMQRVTQRLRTISETLVDFSKLRKQETEPVAAQGLIDEAWSLLAIDERASGVSFTNHVGPGDRVVGNPDRLVQVFVNLLRNAVNAVESPGGRVDVRARRADRAGEPGLAIAVEDNGPGIPADVLPDIFDAFVTTRLDARGTGLGLTVAEGIVTQHGGAIAASNRREGGACLEVWLPAPRNL